MLTRLGGSIASAFFPNDLRASRPQSRNYSPPPPPTFCELWSGKEVVRLIGSPAGMKNLVVVGPKDAQAGAGPRVLDIATACREGLLRSTGLNSGDLASISGTTLDELSEAAPNLALNVKNATAKPIELWVCASIDVALQAAAIVFPGLATNPICTSMLDGHESAWFAMQISQEIDREGAASAMDIQEERADPPARKPLRERIKRMILARAGPGAETDLTYSPAMWELPTLQFRVEMLEMMSETARTPWSDGRNINWAGEPKFAEIKRTTLSTQTREPVSSCSVPKRSSRSSCSPSRP